MGFWSGKPKQQPQITVQQPCRKTWQESYTEAYNLGRENVEYYNEPIPYDGYRRPHYLFVYKDRWGYDAGFNYQCEIPVGEVLVRRRYDNDVPSNSFQLVAGKWTSLAFSVPSLNDEDGYMAGMKDGITDFFNQFREEAAVEEAFRYREKNAQWKEI